MCLAHPRDRLRHRPASTGLAYSSNSGRYCSYIPRYNRWGNLLMKGWESWRIGLLCAVCSVGWSRGAKVATSASTEWTTSPSSSDVAATNLNCRSPPGNIRGRRKRARRLVRACDTARHRWAVLPVLTIHNPEFLRPPRMTKGFPPSRDALWLAAMTRRVGQFPRVICNVGLTYKTTWYYGGSRFASCDWFLREPHLFATFNVLHSPQQV